jgi:hypothetical protein
MPLDNYAVTVPPNDGVQLVFDAPEDTIIKLNLISGFVWIGKKDMTREDGFPLFPGSIYYEFRIPKGQAMYVIGPEGTGYEDTILKVLTIPVNA